MNPHVIVIVIVIAVAIAFVFRPVVGVTRLSGRSLTTRVA